MLKTIANAVVLCVFLITIIAGSLVLGESLDQKQTRALIDAQSHFYVP